MGRDLCNPCAWFKMIIVMIRFGIIILLLSLFSCSSSGKKSQPKDGIALREMLLYNLHYRRPDVPGASPTAIQGESEYETNPRPDARFGCTPLKMLFREIKLGEFRTCLAASVGEQRKLQKPMVVSY